MSAISIQSHQQIETSDAEKVIAGPNLGAGILYVRAGKLKARVGSCTLDPESQLRLLPSCFARIWLHQERQGELK